MALSADQLKCVEAPLDVHILVNAGPGAGKTRVLTQRYMFLRKQGVDVNGVVLMTFTNKAAKEMTTRIAQEIDCSPDYTGTFHHYAYSILRNAGRRFMVLDNYHQVTAVKRILKKEGIQNMMAEDILKAYSFSRNAMTDFRPTDDVQYVINAYERYKSMENYADFDDLLVGLHEVLLGEFEPEGIKHVLVDEFQDTNKLQMEILRSMRGFGWWIYGVGDVNQSIYGFRSADVENIIRFKEEFVPVLVFDLGTNYRSTKQIVSAYAEFIKQNHTRIPVELVALSDGPKPVAVTHQDTYAEANALARLVKKLYKQGTVAVLYRANFLSPPLEKMLLADRIPYVVRGKIKFFEQAHIVPILDLAMFLFNKDPNMLANVLKLLPGIGDASAEHMAALVIMGQYDDAMLKAPSRARTSDVQRFMRHLATVTDYKQVLLYYINHHIRPFVQDKLSNSEKRLEDLKLMVGYITSSSTLDEFMELTSVGAVEVEGESPVVLSTIHSAKGLEWDYVIMMGVAQAIFPHPKSVMEGKLEEERRLMYVAMSRPRKMLYISFVGFSQFMRELSHEFVEWKGDLSHG